MALAASSADHGQPHHCNRGDDQSKPGNHSCSRVALYRRPEAMEPGPSNKIVRTFSDELQEKSPRDGLSRGLAAKVAVDRHRERHPSALQQQWSLFLLDAREMALRSVKRNRPGHG